MRRRWQLQEAKARFSEVVRAADSFGPQVVSLRGRPAAVVVSIRDWRKSSPCKPSLVEFLRNSPLAGAGLKIRRDRSTAREVQL